MSHLESVELLWTAAQMGASDLHLSAGAPPFVRVNGRLFPIELPPLTARDTERILRSLATEEQWRSFVQNGEIAFAYTLPDGSRFRCIAYRQRGRCAAAIRIIPGRIPGFEELGLPEIVKELTRRRNGLVLVTGPAASGKTTTLAAMIDLVNSERNCLIITLEAPIEYIHKHKQGIVNQREVGEDMGSFAGGLRSAVRQDADVILVGEMREWDTASAAIGAAETGKLVLASYDAADAVQTLEDVIDLFPAYQQSRMLARLSTVLKGIISQRLVPRADGKGMALALEIMVVTPAIRILIRDGKTQQIRPTIETGGKYGMQTLEASLKQLAESGIIDRTELLSP